jgi:cysteine desulfurase
MYLKTLGIEVVEVPVNREGRIDLDVFESLCDENTILVSIIYVNNEIGSIQDLQSIDKICFKYHIPLHTDATQAAGKVKIDVSKFSSLQFLTFTAHKIYGPKGIGCLYNRENDLGKKMSLIPLMHGGEQEDGFRAGTMATPLIVGFGKACEIAKRDFDKNQILLEKYENIVLNKLRGKFGVKLILNNAFADRIPGLLNIRLVGYNNMVLLNAISSEIAASTGSACAIAHPSRILKNIGLTDVEISESIRISISAYEDENNFKALDLL